MGEVYKARDTRLERTVAIKILPAQLAADPRFRERFDREAKAISRLSHPHICTLHDVGRHDGIDCLVMEYLEGQTLAQRLVRGALPLDQALQFAVQIADALDKAHSHGIVQSRSEARQHHAHEVGREAAGFRPRKKQCAHDRRRRSVEVADHAADDD